MRAFWESFDGFKRWSLPSAKAKTAESALFSGSLGDGSLQLLEPREVCRVSWSGPHQGLAAHVERYRNSPVMHRPGTLEHRWQRGIKRHSDSRTSYGRHGRMWRAGRDLSSEKNGKPCRRDTRRDTLLFVYGALSCTHSVTQPFSKITARCKRCLVARSVPDEYRPVVFTDGVRQPFPCPTRKAIGRLHGCFFFLGGGGGGMRSTHRIKKPVLALRSNHRRLEQASECRPLQLAQLQ